jgi:hypothetical protein
MIPALEGASLAVVLIIVLVGLLTSVAVLTRDVHRRRTAMTILRMILRARPPDQENDKNDNGA